MPSLASFLRTRSSLLTQEVPGICCAASALPATSFFNQTRRHAGCWIPPSPSAGREAKAQDSSVVSREVSGGSGKKPSSLGPSSSALEKQENVLHVHLCSLLFVELKLTQTLSQQGRSLKSKTPTWRPGVPTEPFPPSVSYSCPFTDALYVFIVAVCTELWCSYIAFLFKKHLCIISDCRMYLIVGHFCLAVRVAL